MRGRVYAGITAVLTLLSAIMLKMAYSVGKEAFATDAASSLPLITDMTLDDIAAGLDAGKFTSAQLVEVFLARIKEVDKIFHSIIEVNPDAVRVAQELDEERKATKKRRSPLHGVPILLKDNIVTLDRMNATAGSFALLGAKPAQESSVVKRLRAAGAILLGKANLTEWANYRWNNSGTGWSPRGGQCTGPYYPNMKASGSSTGSAVSPALGLTFAALGTETDGSIMIPAGRNNVVGLKPTTGLVSRDVVIPASYKQDTVGPFSRTVKDSAHILTQIAGKSPLDPRTDNIPYDTIPDFAASCQGTDLSGVRIGVPRNAFPGIGSVEDKAFTKALETLTQAGAQVVEDTNLLAAEEYRDLPDTDKLMVVHADFKVSIGKYLNSLVTNPNNLHTLQDLIDYTKTHEEEDYPARNVAQFESAQAIDIDSQEYKDVVAREQYIAGDGGIIGALKRHNVDVLVVPTAADTAVTFSAIAGTPAISVPLGFLPPDTPVKKDSKSDLITSGPNIPFPICFFAKHYDEQTLIRVAYAFEQLTNVRNRVQPYKVPKTELRSEKADGTRQVKV